MRIAAFLFLAGCTFQVKGLPVSPGADPQPGMPTGPASITPTGSNSTDAPDLSQLPDLAPAPSTPAAAPDMAKAAPDLTPPPVDCNQDCDVHVTPGNNTTIVCEIGKQCNVQCDQGAQCTLECLGDAQCSCTGRGCKITLCAPVLSCKANQMVCNQKCGPD